MNFEEKLIERIKKLEREVERLRVKESPGGWQDWTPTLNTGAADLSGYDSARFIQNGKLITLTFIAQYKNVTGSSGLIEISLPVNAAVNGQHLSARVYPIGGTYAYVQCRIDTASQVIQLAKGMFVNPWAGNETDVYVFIEGFYEAL